MSRGSGARPVGCAVGDAAWRLRVHGPVEARRWSAAIGGAGLAGVVDVVPTLRSVLVVVDPEALALDALAGVLEGIDPGAATLPRPRTHRLAVRFDGPDVEEVCAQSGLGRAAMVELLCGADLEVAFLGFSPGFGYLTGLPGPLGAVARRVTPRVSVPAGSVALAGGFAAVYPHATPAGWQVVGTTGAVLFDDAEPPYALLAPGDTVRFVVAGDDAPAPPSHRGGATRRPFAPAPGTPAVFEVVDPGVLSLVQDAGRRGYAHLGVPAAGPADPLAHRLANELVGNQVGAGALEMTVRGPRLRCTTDSHIAVVGTGTQVHLDAAPVDPGRVVPVRAGQLLSLGATGAGLRAYLAVAGGLGAPSVLGSVGTDVLAWIGPGPLVAGDRLGLVGAPGPLRDRLAPGAPGSEAGAHAGGPDVALRVVAGPHAEWFAPESLDRLAAASFRVEPTSNRVGLRLWREEGERIERRGGELDSEGTVTGAVQVPPDASPVVLGPDHATTGGYPVLAVVIHADRWLLGQCRPGDVVRFIVVDHDAADAARAAAARAVGGAVVGTYPTLAG